MTVYPNAKINLGLNIVSKRPDGYHNLETVFLPVPALHDELEINPSDASEPYSFVQEGIAVDCPDKDNLIIRAYLRVREHCPQTGNIRIRFRLRDGRNVDLYHKSEIHAELADLAKFIASTV